VVRALYKLDLEVQKSDHNFYFHTV